jgi:hypothetical protein
LPFAVARALNFVRFALLAVSGDMPSEQAARAFSYILEIAETFDTAARKFPAAAQRGNAELALETSEERSQGRLVEILARPTERGLMVQDAKAEADVIALNFKGLLPVYAYHYVSG